MKKNLITAIACVAVLLIVAPSLHAQAVVTRAETCFVTGAPINAPPFLGLPFQDVATPSGNEKFTCWGDIPEEYIPDKAVRLVDGVCGGFTGSGLAHIRYTPGGKVIATCIINPSTD